MNVGQITASDLKTAAAELDMAIDPEEELNEKAGAKQSLVQGKEA